LSSNDQFIVETLVNTGLITRDIGEKAIALSKSQGRDVVELIVESGIASQMEVLSTLGGQFGMEVVVLHNIVVEQEVLDLVPAETAHKYKILPVYRTETSLKVAISDPLAVDRLDDLRYILKTDNVEGCLTTQEEIDAALEKYYGRPDASESLIEEMTQTSVDIASFETDEMSSDEEGAVEDDAPIIKLVSLVIMEAVRKGASDIHIEPMEKILRVRYRIDGVLQEVEPPPKRLQSAIIARLKLMAEIKIAEKRIPQDGRIKISAMGKDLDLRVSTVPTTHGESIVMRILDKESLRLGLPELGFFSDDQASFEKLIKSSDGILLVTGPTGSGKTTTLYSCLNEINKPDRKIITVEDPVEYQLAGINQVQVRTDIGMTFSAALRSMLRQAPNIVMLGEIRDLETAEIAINASLTGHLVFSTLHTNDAPSAVSRLTDMGVKPFLIASSLRAIIAQRLVRSICQNCKEEIPITDKQLRSLGSYADQFEGKMIFQGAGCTICSNSGHKGRKGLFEMFVIDEEVQRMIFDKVSATDLRRKARELGMRTLREDGLRKVIAGVTTLDEVFRVTMGDNA